MPRRTVVHAGHVIAFDGRGHRLLRRGTVIVEDDDPAARSGEEHRLQRHRRRRSSRLGGGRRVVDGGRVLAADERAILAALQAGGERMWPLMRQFDWAGRDADVLSPQTYPEWA